MHHYPVDKIQSRVSIRDNGYWKTPMINSLRHFNTSVSIFINGFLYYTPTVEVKSNSQRNLRECSPGRVHAIKCSSKCPIRGQTPDSRVQHFVVVIEIIAQNSFWRHFRPQLRLAKSETVGLRLGLPYVSHWDIWVCHLPLVPQPQANFTSTYVTLARQGYPLGDTQELDVGSAESFLTQDSDLCMQRTENNGFNISGLNQEARRTSKSWTPENWHTNKLVIPHRILIVVVRSVTTDPGCGVLSALFNGALKLRKLVTS